MLAAVRTSMLPHFRYSFFRKMVMLLNEGADLVCHGRSFSHWSTIERDKETSHPYTESAPFSLTVRRSAHAWTSSSSVATGILIPQL